MYDFSNAPDFIELSRVFTSPPYNMSELTSRKQDISNAIMSAIIERTRVFENTNTRLTAREAVKMTLKDIALYVDNAGKCKDLQFNQQALDKIIGHTYAETRFLDLVDVLRTKHTEEQLKDFLVRYGELQPHQIGKTLEAQCKQAAGTIIASAGTTALAEKAYDDSMKGLEAYESVCRDLLFSKSVDSKVRDESKKQCEAKLEDRMKHFKTLAEEMRPVVQTSVEREFRNQMPSKYSATGVAREMASFETSAKEPLRKFKEEYRPLSDSVRKKWDKLDIPLKNDRKPDPVRMANKIAQVASRDAFKNCLNEKSEDECKRYQKSEIIRIQREEEEVCSHRTKRVTGKCNPKNDQCMENAAKKEAGLYAISHKYKTARALRLDCGQKSCPADADALSDLRKYENRLKMK